MDFLGRPYNYAAAHPPKNLCEKCRAQLIPPKQLTQADVEIFYQQFKELYPQIEGETTT